MQRFDVLVFSSLLPALVAAALLAASARAFGIAAPWSAMLFAACGTFVVYAIDRLRDIERDRATSPARAAFVARHGRALRVACAAAAVGALALAPTLPPPALALCAAVAAAGLLHRRLKRTRIAKTAYIAAAWLAVVVGIPALLAAAPRGALLRVGAVLGLALAANLVASNVRDREGAAGRWPPQVGVAFAAALCGVAGVLAWQGGAAADGRVRALLAIPLAQGLAIAPLGCARPLRDRERYGHLVVDGALLAGALIAIAAAR